MHAPSIHNKHRCDRSRAHGSAPLRGIMYEPDIHHRRSIRLKDYDYAGTGAYFLTICTFQRECLFGEVVDGDMRLNDAGYIVHEEWQKTAVMRPNVIVDLHMVMPNHFHSIIVVGAHCMRPVAAGNVGAHCGAPNPKGACNAPLRRTSGSVGSIVAGFKSAVTKRVNALRDNPGCPVWQRNYYEHIIRNKDDLANIRRYIAENPLKWDLDENNPANVVV